MEEVKAGRTAAGGDLRHSVLGRAPSEDPRRRHVQNKASTCDRGQHGGQQGSPGLGRRTMKARNLAADPDDYRRGAKDFFHRLRGGLKVSGTIESVYRGTEVPVVYRATWCGIAELRELEATQEVAAIAADLPGRHGNEAEMQRTISRASGRGLPHGDQILAPELGTDHSVFRVSGEIRK